MLDNSKPSGARTNVPWAVSIAPVEEDAEADGEGVEPASSSEQGADPATPDEPAAAQPSPEQTDPTPAPATPAVEESATSQTAADQPAPDAQPAPVEPAAPPQMPDQSDSEVHCDIAVVRALMDLLIMPDGMIQPQERAFAADLLQMVIGHANTKSKTLLCERLANMSDAPPALISRFLHDTEIDIAAPLLLRASCVSESELISVVESGDIERSRLIAQRRHLAPVVSTALAKTDNEDIELDLVSNTYAQLSQEAVERLTCRAEANPKLNEALVLRPEMTTACALQLFWSMSTKQRAYALGRFLVDVQVLRQVLVMSEPGAELIARAVRGSGDGPQVEKSKQESAPATHQVADLVSALASAQIDDLVRLMTMHADITKETAVRIIEDKGGEPLAVACKAIGVARFAFADAIEKCPTAPDWGGDIEALKILFDTLSFRQARMALTYWDWQTRRVGPYTDFPCGT